MARSDLVPCRLSAPKPDAHGDLLARGLIGGYRSSANVQAIADSDIRLGLPAAWLVTAIRADATAWRDSGLAEVCGRMAVLGGRVAGQVDFRAQAASGPSNAVIVGLCPAWRSSGSGVQLLPAGDAAATWKSGGLGERCLGAVQERAPERPTCRTRALPRCDILSR
ncbi:hypothetical protein FB157_14625 [Streptomyces sp. BK340]|nr:hypothetical protein FB157_14625 [Streptomyces sp. BK340]